MEPMVTFASHLTNDAVAEGIEEIFNNRQGGYISPTGIVRALANKIAREIPQSYSGLPLTLAKDALLTEAA